MQTLTVSFTPTKQDYTRSIRSFYLSTPLYWGILIAVTPILLNAIFLLITAAIYGNHSSLIGFVFLVCLFFLVFKFARSRKSGSKAQNESLLQSPITWEFAENQVIVKNEFAETKRDWRVFQKVIETKEYYLLVDAVNKNFFQFVPKRAFKSQDEEILFVELLKQKIDAFQSEKEITRKRRIVFGAVGAVVFVLMICIISLLAYTFMNSIR